MASISRVAVALGSNQGDRDRILTEAIASLRSHIDNVQASRFHDTEPVGVAPQPRFLNAAITGVTRLGPRELLDALLGIERTFGRQRPFPGAARTLDLDLILYADRTIDEPGLVVPHPRFRERSFVLEPLAEIASEWKDPLTGRSVAELLAALAGSR